MKKLNLKKSAEEFEMIDSETHLFYNIETGEFDFYSDFMDGEKSDSEKFEDDVWIAAPNQRDIGELHSRVVGIIGAMFTFYKKLGYKIVNVIPEANGIGKPDILMAKRIKNKV